MRKTVDIHGLAKGGPYSHAVITDYVVFVSGQTGAKKGERNSFEDQFRRSMNNIQDILKEADSSLEKVNKINVYLSKASDFNMLNNLFSEYFKNDPPARTTLVTRFVNDEILVEVDVTASR